MRILWFTNTMSCYTPVGNDFSRGYNGGGWISSAERIIKTEKDIELAVSFICDNQPFKQIQKEVAYYPVPSYNCCETRYSGFIKDLLYAGSFKKERAKWHYYTDYYNKIISDFRPDVIHVWGSEFYSGLVSMITKTPVVLHIQGSLIPYYNAFLPPFFSWKSFIFSTWNPFRVLRQYVIKKQWEMDCYREQEIYNNVNMFLGRTEWDKSVSHVLNPSSHYFHVDEILRDVFYKNGTRVFPQKLTIVTTISHPIYKGFDLILKTAKLLKDRLHLDFEWNCYGNVNPSLIEKQTGINHSDVNVILKGVISPEELYKAELESTLYFHPSYIDNSPNSLCEAQILGIPVVCTDVGGVSSLVQNKITGFTIPANDPFQGATIIEMLYMNKELNYRIGDAGKAEAQKRHNVERIKNQLLYVYNSVISQS